MKRSITRRARGRATTGNVNVVSASPERARLKLVLDAVFRAGQLERMEIQRAIDSGDIVPVDGADPTLSLSDEALDMYLAAAVG